MRRLRRFAGNHAALYGTPTPTPSGFSDPFTDTDGVLLSAHSTGWTELFGVADLEINTNQVRAQGNGSSGNFVFYARPTGGPHRAKADLLNLTNGHLVVMGSDSGSGTFNGYGVRKNAADAVRVCRWDAGAAAFQSPITGLPDTLEIEIEATDTGSATEVKVYQRGVQIGATWADSTGSRRTSGRRGLYYNGGHGGVSPGLFDNYSDGGAAS